MVLVSLRRTGCDHGTCLGMGCSNLWAPLTASGSVAGAVGGGWFVSPFARISD